MKRHLNAALLVLALFTSATTHAQNDHGEEQTPRHATDNLRLDYSIFHRQIIATLEFAEQRRKVASLRKEGKGICKIYAIVDSNAENDDDNLLTGYIQLVNKASEANVYEFTYDRKQKKIVYVKSTGEKLEFDEDEAPAEKAAKPKHAKKKGDDDESEDDD